MFNFFFAFTLLSMFVLIIGGFGFLLTRKKAYRQISLACIAGMFIFFAGFIATMPPTATATSTANNQEQKATPEPKQTPAITVKPKPIETPEPTKEPTIKTTEKGYDVTLTFPAERYPETYAHIKEAIDSGESSVCTIDRSGADDNREQSLRGIKTKKGYDRDEWPMAMCAEGGAGADIEYVTPSDNRGSGAWVGNQLEDYADGTRVLFVID